MYLKMLSVFFFFFLLFWRSSNPLSIKFFSLKTQISVSQLCKHRRISFAKTTTISRRGRATLLGPHLANSVTVPAKLRGVLSNDFFWFNHVSFLPRAVCSLSTVFPASPAQADSALKREAGTLMDPSSSS